MTDKTSTAPVMSLRQVRDALQQAHNSPGLEAVLDSCVAAIDAHLSAPTPDVVGGDVVEILRAVRENGYACYLAGGGDRDGFQAKIDAVLAAPRVQGDAEQSVEAVVINTDGQIPPGFILQVVSARRIPDGTKLYASLAAQPKTDVSGDAHELWALAQLGPNEGMLDAVERIEALLREHPAAQPKGDNKRVYAVPADSTSDGGHQLYTIHDEPVPMADNWCLIDALSHPAEQTRGEIPACERCGECRRGNFGACKNRRYFEAQPNSDQPRGEYEFRFPVRAETAEADNATRNAWNFLKPQLAPKDWTAGESSTFYGFFAWGWEAACQYHADDITKPKPEQTRGDGVKSTVNGTLVSAKVWALAESKHPHNGDMRVGYAHGYSEALAAPRQAVPDGLNDPDNPWRRAVEHAGYLVTNVEQYMEARNAENLAFEQVEGADDPSDEQVSELEAAQQATHDHWCGMRSGIFEFTKRRDRAMATLAAPSAGRMGVG